MVQTFVFFSVFFLFGLFFLLLNKKKQEYMTVKSGADLITLTYHGAYEYKDESGVTRLKFVPSEKKNLQQKRKSLVARKNLFFFRFWCSTVRYGVFFVPYLKKMYYS